MYVKPYVFYRVPIIPHFLRIAVPAAADDEEDDGSSTEGKSRLKCDGNI
jgi:hypothetical protein